LGGHACHGLHGMHGGMTMGKKHALARLMKLEAWLDTDEEVLAAMNKEERLDHEFILVQVRRAIEELNDG